MERVEYFEFMFYHLLYVLSVKMMTISQCKNIVSRREKKVLFSLLFPCLHGYKMPAQTEVDGQSVWFMLT